MHSHEISLNLLSYVGLTTLQLVMTHQVFCCCQLGTAVTIKINSAIINFMPVVVKMSFKRSFYFLHILKDNSIWYKWNGSNFPTADLGDNFLNFKQDYKSSESACCRSLHCLLTVMCKEVWKVHKCGQTLISIWHIVCKYLPFCTLWTWNRTRVDYIRHSHNAFRI